jgi:pre-mRNA-splicing factor CDC5/CEF1
MRHKNKKGGMDYMADIPFEKQPAPGFYDITEEDARRAHAPVGRTIRQMDGKRKKDDDDEAERRKRQKKAQEAKNAQSHFQPEKDMQIQRLKEAEQISKRRRLDLPEAQVGDAELEEIVKIGQAGESARELVEDGGNEAGRGLLGDYSALEHAKNARTPRTAPEGRHDADIILVPPLLTRGPVHSR